MAEPVTSALVVTHELPSVSADALAETVLLLERRDVRLFFPPREWEKHEDILAGSNASRVEEPLGSLPGTAVCVVLGGDGTMLRALRLTRRLGIPVAGVALGRVSFFATIRREHIDVDLGRVLDGDYVAHPMVGLAGELEGAHISAVNDIVVGRAQHSGICRLSYALNGVTLFDLGCDSLIVSTPAGSSAYSLSAGGPLLGFGVDGFVLTFVAPHALGARPVVAAGGDLLEITNRSGHQAVEVGADGEQVGILDVGSSLRLRMVPHMAALALLPEQNLYHHFQERFLKGK
jgi:NAD+ kinase